MDNHCSQLSFDGGPSFYLENHHPKGIFHEIFYPPKMQKLDAFLRYLTKAENTLDGMKMHIFF